MTPAERERIALEAKRLARLEVAKGLVEGLEALGCLRPDDARDIAEAARLLRAVYGRWVPR